MTCLYLIFSVLLFNCCAGTSDPRSFPVAPGDESCWTPGFSWDLCCHPRFGPRGNEPCWIDAWDEAGAFTYERCCFHMVASWQRSVIQFPRKERVAVLIDVLPQRLQAETLKSIHTNLISKIPDCDVFARVKIDEGQNPIELQPLLLEQLSPIGTLANYKIETDMSAAEVRDVFLRSIAQNLDESYFQSSFSGWKAEGNSLLGLSQKFLMLSSLYSLMDEYEQRHGFQYDRVIFQRADMFYYAPHPPLHLLSSEYIWIPEGQDWGGLNDKHAVFSRSHAERYLLRWNDLVSGELVRWYGLTDWARSNSLWAEMALFLALSPLRDTREHIPVARFLPVAHLKCCSCGPQCLNRPCQNPEAQWRYLNEGADSFAVSNLIRQGWEWRIVQRGLIGSRTFEPGCFVNASERQRCCDETEFVGGTSSCWERSEVLSFHLCCTPDIPQLSVRQPPELAEAGKVCWGYQSVLAGQNYISCISKALISAGRVAVCAIGPSEVDVVNLEVRAQVVSPLGADLFVISNPTQAWLYSPEDYDRMMSYYVSFTNFFLFEFVEDGDAEIKAIINGGALNPNFLLTLLHSNDAFSKGVWELWLKRECYNMIREHEAVNNFQYDWIISLRENYYLRASHPPLHLMSDEYLWSSEGGDGFGLNDRHVVVPRKYAHRYFRRFESLLSGRFEQLFNSNFYSGISSTLNSLPEVSLLLETLDSHDPIPVARFLPVGMLWCPPSSGCLPSPGLHNDPIELLDAQGVANLLRNGWQWHLTERGSTFSRILNPSCFDARRDGTTQKECCSSRQLFAGDYSCWKFDGFHHLSFDSCCVSGKQLSLRPITSLEGGFCWPIAGTQVGKVQSCIVE